MTLIDKVSKWDFQLKISFDSDSKKQSPEMIFIQQSDHPSLLVNRDLSKIISTQNKNNFVLLQIKLIKRNFDN